MSRKHFKRLFVDNMKKTRLNGYVSDFSVNYNTIAVADKMGQYEMFGFLKQIFVSAMMFFGCNALN